MFVLHLRDSPAMVNLLLKSWLWRQAKISKLKPRLGRQVGVFPKMMSYAVLVRVLIRQDFNICRARACSHVRVGRCRKSRD